MQKKQVYDRSLLFLQRMHDVDEVKNFWISDEAKQQIRMQLEDEEDIKAGQALEEAIKKD